MSNFFYDIASVSAVAAHQAHVVASADAAKHAHAAATAAHRAKIIAESALRRDDRRKRGK